MRQNPQRTKTAKTYIRFVIHGIVITAIVLGWLCAAFVIVMLIVTGLVLPFLLADH